MLKLRMGDTPLVLQVCTFECMRTCTYIHTFLLVRAMFAALLMKCGRHISVLQRCLQSQQLLSFRFCDVMTLVVHMDPSICVVSGVFACGCRCVTVTVERICNGQCNGW